MAEQPLFHRAKWTGHDRKTLIQEVMRGGDWIERTSRSLGRTESAVAGEARRLLTMGVTPAGFRERYYASRAPGLIRKVEQQEKTSEERARMARSFEATTGVQIAPTPLPSELAEVRAIVAEQEQQIAELTRQATERAQPPPVSAVNEENQDAEWGSEEERFLAEWAAAQTSSVAREMARVCKAALCVVIYDRDHTEGIVGEYMTGNNWWNFGGFVDATESLYRILLEVSTSKPAPATIDVKVPRWFAALVRKGWGKRGAC